MSNVNDYKFSNKIEGFKQKVLDPHLIRVRDAEIIMQDATRKWDTPEQETAAKARYESLKAWGLYYQSFYDEGAKLCAQHESLVNTMSKVYDNWYQNISNEGKQETELMSSQADMLAELFGEIYKELQPLKLEGMKPPQAMNL